MATQRKDTSGLAPVIESPVQQPVKAKEERFCACGCGKTTGKTWAIGHDARHKGRLLERFDEGDTDAGTELVNRGWYTQERLAERATKRTDRQIARDARAAAKAERAATAKAAKPKAKAGAKAPATELDELVEGGVAAATAAIGGKR